jgi:RPA family protein
MQPAITTQPTRMPAKKTRIFDIANGRYFPGSREDMRPSYIITPLGEKVSRVNIIATVTEKFLSDDGSYSSITIDDGTEAIRVKAFRETVPLLMGIELGSLVLVIGKVKEFNGELYINGEVVKNKIDVNFESLRKLEILNKTIQQKKIANEIRNMSNELSDEELKDYAKNKYSIDEESLQAILESKKLEIDYKPKIMEVIASLDTGEGIEIGKLFEVLDLPENIIEKTLDELLSQGFIFEPKVGYLKKV